MSMELTKDLLKRAADKTNDSSEEKLMTEFFNDIISDTSYTTDFQRLQILMAAAAQMKGFAELVISVAADDLYSSRHEPR